MKAQVNNIEELRKIKIGDLVEIVYPEGIYPHHLMVFEGFVNHKYSFIRPYRENQGIDGNSTNLDIFYRRYKEEDISFKEGALVFNKRCEFGKYKFDDLSEDYLKRAKLINNAGYWRSGFFKFPNK